MDKSSATKDDVIEDAEAEEVFLDGGYAWVIVFATFMNSFIAEGISDSLSNFHVAFIEDFKVNRAKTSWVISTALGMSFIPGPFVGVLIEWLGSRTVTIAGSLTIFVGLFIGSYMQSIESLIFPVGIIGGIGFCLMTMPQLVIVSEYFHYRLGLAVGISVAGSAAGSIVLGGPVVDYLIRNYDWRYSMRIASYIALGGIIFGSLLTPANYYLSINTFKRGSTKKNGGVPVSSAQKSTAAGANIDEQNELEKGKNLNTKRDISMIELPEAREENDQLSADTPEGIFRDKHHQKDETMIESKKVELLVLNNGPKQPSVTAPKLKIKITRDKMKTDFTSCVKRIFNLNYITNLGMFLYLAGNLFGNIGFYAPAILIKDRVMYDKITDGQGASWLIAINALAEFFGRLATGFVVNFIIKDSRPHAYAITTLIAGLLTIVTAFSTDYLLIALYMFLFGFVSGATTILEPIILQDLFNPDTLTGLYGMMLSLTGLGTIFGMPIIGKIHDVTSSYQGGYLMAGVLVGFSGLLFFGLKRACRVSEPIMLEIEPAILLKPRSYDRKLNDALKIDGQISKSSDVIATAKLGLNSRPKTIKDSSLLECRVESIPNDTPITKRTIRRPIAVFKQLVTPKTIVRSYSPQSLDSNEILENRQALTKTEDLMNRLEKTENIFGTSTPPPRKDNQ